MPLETLVVKSLAKHTATVIIVHGLGDTGHGWAPVAEMFKTDLAHVKWILPHAPMQPVTGNAGLVMPSWFDIFDFDFDPEKPMREDELGMMKTVYSLSQLITNEVDAGIPAERIVLSGFSQGGAMTLLTGLTIERRLAGLAVLSGWAPIPTQLKMAVNRHAKTLPIFWGHGVADPLVRYSIAQKSLEFLKDGLGVPTVWKETSELPERFRGIAFHSYAGLGHSTSPKELNDLKAWLENVIPATP